jgi:hypothetical protein
MNRSASSDPIEGAWRTARYVVDNLPRAIDGVLLLVDGRWATVYFVPEREGLWGSGEAGAYELAGETLSFHHRLTFQGGGGRPLYLTQEATHVETCPITIAGDTLTIQFPGGNTLVCERLHRGDDSRNG